MSYAQKQIIDMAPALSDADAGFIAGVMKRLISLGKSAENVTDSQKAAAFRRLETMVGGFPADFDPDKELAEARNVKYGIVD